MRAAIAAAAILAVLHAHPAKAAAQETDETTALAERAGVDETDLRGAAATTHLEPLEYLYGIGALARPIPPAPAFGVWDRLAQCESHGNWATNTGNGYWGGLQFDLQTWRAYGGVGLPSQASRATQIAVAERLRAARGYQPWPVCSRQVGLR